MSSTITFQAPKFRFPARLVLIAALAILALIFVFTSYFTVSPESVGIVKRFGRFSSIAEPGLHFKLPMGIDTATVLPIRRQLKLEFGYSSEGSTNPDQAGEAPDLERDMVTGDLNAAQVEWIVQYSISSPKDYLFNLRDPGPTLRDLSESAMREIIGDRTVDEVLTIGRTGIETAAFEKLSLVTKSLNLGITVDHLQIMSVHPPAAVQRAFEDVNRAQQERETMVNQANGEYNKVIPRARGLAQQKISAAEGYAFQRINSAHGDVARFRELLTQYEKAPAVTKQRLYLETMGDVLPKLGSKIIIDQDAKQLLPLLNLSNQAK